MAAKRKQAKTPKRAKDLEPRKGSSQKVKGGYVGPGYQSPLLERVAKKLPRGLE